MRRLRAHRHHDCAASCARIMESGVLVMVAGAIVAAIPGCKSSATSPTGDRPAVQVSVGVDFACAARIGGNVQCWGNGEASGSSPDGSPFRPLPPTTIAGVGRVRQVAAGFDQACALSDDGSVRCWGKNGNGQCAPIADLDCATPTLIDGIEGAVRIAAGHSFTCALLSDGTVHCWSRVCGAGRERLVCQIPGVEGAVDLSSGADDHACALLQGGRVACWGANVHGELGGGSVGDGQWTATIVAGVEDARAIAVAEGHSSALLDNGTVLCWGHCGSANALTPTPIPNMTGAVDLGDGANFDNCVRTAAGRVRCACLGVPGGTFTTYRQDYVAQKCDFSFETVPDLDEVTAVSAFWQPGGFTTACAVRGDGSVWCWGDGTEGMLGDGVDHSFSDAGPRVVAEPQRVPLSL